MTQLQKFKVGQEVIVVPPRARSFTNDPPVIPARITKVNRVWLDLEENDPVRKVPRTWRMRAHEQHDGNMQYSQFRYHFYTHEQWAERQQERQARAGLRLAGISFAFTSPFERNAALQIKLAEAVESILGDADGW